MISIGKMPQACPMSVRTLRWYDQIGPLHPEYVDEKTGFRCCAPEQIEQILLIRRYKRFGFSLQEIGELLQASQTQIQKAPAHTLEEMQIQIERQRQRQEEIRQILSDRPERIFMNRTIELVKTEKTPVYALHAVTSIAEYGGLMSRLFEEADKKQLRLCGGREPGISIRTLIRKKRNWKSSSPSALPGRQTGRSAAICVFAFSIRETTVRSANRMERRRNGSKKTAMRSSMLPMNCI